MVDIIAAWTAVFFTLGIYSILYRENPWYRIAESVYLGVAVGYGVSVDLLYIRNQWSGQWSSNMGMVLLFAIVIIVGLLWYGRFNKSTFFLYRWPLAIVVGTGIGMALRTVIDAQFLQQIVAQTKTPFFVAGNMGATINNILIQIMVPSVLLYFWFTGTIRESAPMKIVEKIARYTMMAGFGSAYGYTVLTRYSLFIGRSQFLLGIPPNEPTNQLAFIVIAFIMLASMIGWDLTHKKAPEV
jgi:lipoprotein signal peptidase